MIENKNRVNLHISVGLWELKHPRSATELFHRNWWKVSRKKFFFRFSPKASYNLSWRWKPETGVILFLDFCPRSWCKTLLSLELLRGGVDNTPFTAKQAQLSLFLFLPSNLGGLTLRIQKHGQLAFKLPGNRASAVRFGSVTSFFRCFGFFFSFPQSKSWECCP